MEKGETSNPKTLWEGGFWWRLGGAVGAAGMLLLFLVVVRWWGTERTPNREIRLMDTADFVAPPEPLAPESETAAPTPPPPPPPKLPQLDISVLEKVPVVPSSPVRRTDLSMQPAVFEWETDPASSPVLPLVRPSPTMSPETSRTPTRPQSAPSPPAAPALKTVYQARELDAKPHLLNRPTATFPSSLRKRGIREGRVTLEVSVSTSGRVTVLRVISASHPEFGEMARTVASRARFSVPKKNGRAVTAIYNWPLVLQQ